jgi:hypothetical protein
LETALALNNLAVPLGLDFFIDEDFHK